MPRPEDVEIGRLIISRGLASQDAVRAAWAQSGERSLVDVLVERGQLDAQTANGIRFHFREAPVATEQGTRIDRVQPPPETRDELSTNFQRAKSTSGERRGGLPGPGDEIDGLVIEDLLGSGGMGAVYKARPRDGGDPVAIKLITSNDPEARERFKVEVEAMARVDNHPGIVRVRRAGKTPAGQAFAVVDLVEGESLAQMLRRGPLEVDRAIGYIEKVARAVHHCHAAGVLHRDLKPGNVLVRREDDEPLVTDFGIALAADRERLTRTGTVLGTPAYMAPEQLVGKGAIDARADVYALGAMLYELLAGQPPFGRGERIHDTIRRVVSERPRPPSTARGGIAPEADAICIKALEKVPDDRYATAGALADDLARFLKKEEVVARPLSAGAKLRRSLARHVRLAAVAMLTLSIVGAAALVAVERKSATEAFQNAADALRKELGREGRPVHPAQRASGALAPLEKAFDQAASSARRWRVAVSDDDASLAEWARLLRESEALVTDERPSEPLATLAACALVRRALGERTPSALAAARDALSKVDDHELATFCDLADDRADALKTFDAIATIASGTSLYSPAARLALASTFRSLGAAVARGDTPWPVLEEKLRDRKLPPEAAQALSRALASFDAKKLERALSEDWEKSAPTAKSATAVVAALDLPADSPLRSVLANALEKHVAKGVKQVSDPKRTYHTMVRTATLLRESFSCLVRVEPDAKADPGFVTDWYHSQLNGYIAFQTAPEHQRTDMVMAAALHAGLLYDLGYSPAHGGIGIFDAIINFGLTDQIRRQTDVSGRLVLAQVLARTAFGDFKYHRKNDPEIARQSYSLLMVLIKELEPRASSNRVARNQLGLAYAAELQLMAEGFGPTDAHELTENDFEIAKEIGDKALALLDKNPSVYETRADVVRMIALRRGPFLDAATTQRMGNAALEDLLEAERSILKTDEKLVESKDELAMAEAVAHGQPFDAPNELAEIRQHCADICEARGEPQEALANLERAVVHAKRSVQRTYRGSLDLERATLLLKMHREKEALAVLDAVLGDKSADVEPAGGAGLRYEIQASQAESEGDLPRALQLTEKAIELCAQSLRRAYSGSDRYLRAVYLRKLGREREALVQIDELIAAIQAGKVWDVDIGSAMKLKTELEKR